MEYKYHVSFVSKDNGSWQVNQELDNMAELRLITENISIVNYSSGVEMMQVSLPNRVWHVFCNFPVSVAPALDAESIRNKIDQIVEVTL